MTKGCEAAMLKNLSRSDIHSAEQYSCGIEHLLGHHVGPQGHLGSSVPKHLVRDGGKMVDQAQIRVCICPPLGLRVNSKLGKRKLSGLPPQLHSSFDFWSPQEIGLQRSLWRVGHHGGGAVHVIAPNLVFGAIAAVSMSAFETCQTSFENAPLWECLITANMSPLASLAALSGLGVTAPRGASAWSSHWMSW